MSCKFSLSNRKCFKHLEIHSSPKNIVNSQIKKKLLLQLWTYCLKRNLFSVTSIAHYKQLFNVFDNLKKKSSKKYTFPVPFINFIVLLFELCEWIHKNFKNIHQNTFAYLTFHQRLTFTFISKVFFFLIGFHSMQGWIATTRHGVTRKKA